MAKVHRDPARHEIETSYKKIRTYLTITFIVLFILGTALGYLVTQKTVLSMIIAISVIIASVKFIEKKLDVLKTEVENHIKGAQGEIAVGLILENILSDEYNLFYDIPTNRGNIDLLVIGPTGVHAIDVKNWKGKITSNENEELVQDGEPRDFKPKNFLSICIEEIKKKIGLNHINCIIAFRHNNFDINEKLKENIIFTSLDKLSNAIIENTKGRLNKNQIEELTKAFEKFAHDRDK